MSSTRNLTVKTLTITALMATIVAIPLVIRRNRALARLAAINESREDEFRRHDLFDFLGQET
jgi:hypothetical protein